MFIIDKITKALNSVFNQETEKLSSEAIVKIKPFDVEIKSDSREMKGTGAPAIPYVYRAKRGDGICGEAFVHPEEGNGINISELADALTKVYQSGRPDNQVQVLAQLLEESLLRFGMCPIINDRYSYIIGADTEPRFKLGRSQKDFTDSVKTALDEVAATTDKAQDEPDQNERDQFHAESVAWLAERYTDWPANTRDWVFVNKRGTGERFMAAGITLNSGCVVLRSEWADKVNNVRPPKKCVLLGNGCTANHHHTVIIGSNISSDRDYQLKIGSNDIQCSRDISNEEFEEMRKVFAALASK